MESYGARSNVLLNRTYGFTQPPDIEPSWSYCLRPDVVRSVYDIFLPDVKDHHVVLLESKRMEDLLCTALNKVALGGHNATEFLRLVCKRCMVAYERDAKLQPALEALRHVRSADPTSSAWWAELDGANSSLTEEEGTRIKMCEYLCLTAHLDAVSFAWGGLTLDQCLAGTEPLCKIIRDSLQMLREGRCFSVSIVSPIDPADECIS